MIALDEPQVDQGDGQVRMGVDLAWRDPPQLASRLRSRRPLDLAAAEEVNEKMKAARGRAPHLVAGDGAQVTGAIARLLEELAPRGILEMLVVLDTSAGQEPCAGERTGGLFDDQDASGVIDAGDDRAKAGALPRQWSLPLDPSATVARASWWASAKVAASGTGTFGSGSGLACVEGEA